MRILTSLMLAMACGLTATAQTSLGNAQVFQDCVVKYIEKASIPAEAEGKLVEINFEEGSDVEAGALLAKIDDESADLTVELKKAEVKEAELAALNEVQLEDARNSEKLASEEAESYKKIASEGGVPWFDYQKKVLEAKRANLQIELAKRRILEAKARYLAKKSEQKIAEHQLKKHSIRAMFPGFVESREARKGEWVQPGTPIATIIQMNKLRVEGTVPNSSQLIKGTPVSVRVFTSADRATVTEVPGTIDFIGSNLNLDGKVRIWVDVENTKQNGSWLIKPGMDAEIVIR